MSLPWEVCFFNGGGGMSECRGKIRRAEVSRSAIPVWYSQNGKVNSKWLSACQKERTLTSHLMKRIADSLNVTKACQRVVSNGGASGVDGMKVEELKEWVGNNLGI